MRRLGGAVGEWEGAVEGGGGAMGCRECASCQNRRRLRTKLLAELPEGALIIDYTDALGKGGAGHGGQRRFVLAEQVRAPVSWDSQHTFWVWRCECAAVPQSCELVGRSASPQQWTSGEVNEREEDGAGCRSVC